MENKLDCLIVANCVLQIKNSKQKSVLLKGCREIFSVFRDEFFSLSFVSRRLKTSVMNQ